ncbi:HNH endonuclease [Herbiconiux sp. 11R-BC]|uniref:HNH endonuclease n=1 Tax=Herbiconiux sp. 11R-BC TaxID=3111637 RepID=UPI003C2BA243
MEALVRSGAPCSRCGVPIGLAPWDTDHLIGLAQGGRNTAENLWPAHKKCNRSDGGRRGRAQQLGRSLKDDRGEPKW